MPSEIACIHFKFELPTQSQITTIVGFVPLQVCACRVAKANWMLAHETHPAVTSILNLLANPGYFHFLRQCEELCYGYV